MSQSKKLIRFYYLTILITLVCLTGIIYSEIKVGSLELVIFNVGQGDSIFIRTPNHRNILIDGGPDNTVVYKLGQYLPFYDRTIDLMILTHPHDDHLTGLIEVLKRYRVEKVISTGVVASSVNYSTWLQLIKDHQIDFEVIDRPAKMVLDNQVRLVFLSPAQSFLNQKVKNLNNSSVVAKLVFGQFSAWLVGDYELEESLVKNNFDLPATLLKVGHHGSVTANSPEFLQAVKPAIAVISYGQNSFGHPNEPVVDNLKNLGAQIFFTKESGDFILLSDGQTVLR